MVPSASSNAFHLVVATFVDRCSLEIDGEVVSCSLPDAKRVGRITVGDRVDVDAQRRIVAVAERRTVLSRPDPRASERQLLVAANVDVVVVVAAVIAPPLKPRLIDRYWIAAQRGGAEVVLAVNKIDLAGDAEGRAAATVDVAPYVAAGLPVVTTSTTTGEGIDAIRRAIGARMAVFVGHSGVGKSSLVNAVLGDERVKAGAVSDAHKKGKHTTTNSSVHRLPGGGSVIDTPGVRAFGIWAVDAASLASYFPDFDALAGSCKFGDCAHTSEPRCAVVAAVETGGLAAARYDAYRRLLASLSEA